METYFPDTKTYGNRIGAWYDRHYHVSPIIRKVVYTLLMVSMILFFLTKSSANLASGAVSSAELKTVQKCAIHYLTYGN